MNLLTIDAGVKACALSCFVNCRLIAVADTLAWRWGALAQHTDIVCETMRVYADAAKKLKPQHLIAQVNDLLAVQAAGLRLVGQIEAACTSTKAIYLPTAREWKGQIPKPVHHGQILRALEPWEMAVLIDVKSDIVEHVDRACKKYARSKSLTGYNDPIHNTLDSVGIGLKHLKRIQ